MSKESDSIRTLNLETNGKKASDVDEKSMRASEEAMRVPLLQIITGKSYNAFAHEDESKYPDGGRSAWIVCIGSSVGLMTVFGIMQTISSIQIYIQSHMLKDVSTSSVSWVFSLYMFCNLLLGIVAGPMFDLYGVRKVLFVGMVINCGGLYATAYSSKLWHFILSFGLCSGIGSGLVLNPLISVLGDWFLYKRGMAIGIAQAGSIAGVFFPIMLRSLYPSIGYTNTMVVLASICVFLSIVSFCLVRDRRSEFIDADAVKDKSVWQNIKECLDYRAFKQKAFALLVGGLFFNEFALLLVITYIGAYGEVRGMSESAAYILITVMNSAGVLGKLLVNGLSDRFGHFNAMTLTSFCMALTVFVMWLPFYNVVVLYIFSAFFGFLFSASYSLTPTTIFQLSKGSKGSLYATAYFVVAWGNLLSLPVGTSLIKSQTVKNYNKMIIFAGCASVVATIFFVLSRTALVGKRLWKFV